MYMVFIKLVQCYLTRSISFGIVCNWDQSTMIGGEFNNLILYQNLCALLGISVFFSSFGLCENEKSIIMK